MGTANLGTIDIGIGQSVQLSSVNLGIVDVSHNVPGEYEAIQTTTSTTTQYGTTDLGGVGLSEASASLAYVAGGETSYGGEATTTTTTTKKTTTQQYGFETG